MTIILNGSDHEMEPGTTLSQLLEQMGMKRDGIAVAVDSRVVPKSTHDQIVLFAGARVEVIRAVGGG